MIPKHTDMVDPLKKPARLLHQPGMILWKGAGAARNHAPSPSSSIHSLNCLRR